MNRNRRPAKSAPLPRWKITSARGLRRRLLFETLETRQMFASPVGFEFRANSDTSGSQTSPAVASDSAGDFVVVWSSKGEDGSGYGIFGQRYNSAGAAQGNEFQINTYTTGDQFGPAVAMDSAGDFVVAWTSKGQDNSSYGVYAQLYASSGSAVGGEFRANTFTISKQTSPAVAMDSAGDFVIAWSSSGQDAASTYGVYAQLYSASGAAEGSEFRVNTYTTGNQLLPSVGMDSAGDFVIAWESYRQDGNSYGIFVQRYTAAGATEGAEFRVNTYTTGPQSAPSVALDSAGDFVVAWTSAAQDGDQGGIFFARYDSSGSPQGNETLVNTYTTGAQTAAKVAMDRAGDFVVAWQSTLGDGSGLGVYAERYNAAGVPQGSQFLANTYTTGNQELPAVALDAAGDAVIVWASNAQDGNSYGVYGQRFVPSTGGQIQVNTYTTGIQYNPVVASDAAGDFVVVWNSQNEDGSGYGVFAQLYTAAGAPQGSEFRVNSYTTGVQQVASVAMDAAGDFVVAWQSAGEDGSGYGIFAQRYNSSGAPQGGEFQVNSYTFSAQETPAVAMDAAGDFAIAWVSNGQGAFLDVYAQRYNAQGAPQGSEFRVNTYSTGNHELPSAAMDAIGDLVITWESSSQDGDGFGIFAQRYSATGAAIGSEFQVNTYTTGDQLDTKVAMDLSGDFVIAWVSNGQDGSGAGVYAQRYNALGVAQGSEFLVNSQTSNGQFGPAVAMDAAGDFAITWTNTGPHNINTTTVQTFTAAGAPNSIGEFDVDPATASSSVPAIAMDFAGDFVVAWESASDGNSAGIEAQQFDSRWPASLPGFISIYGANGDDAVDLAFGDATHFSLSGGASAAVLTTAQVNQVAFVGVAGAAAQVVMQDTFNAYTAAIGLGSAQMTAGKFKFSATNASTLYLYAGSNSTASFTAPKGNDFFVGTSTAPNYSYLTDGTSNYTEASGFGSVTSKGAGGATYAYLYSTSQASVTAQPGVSTTLTAGSFSIAAQNFPQIYAVGAPDGTDTITLNSGGDKFVGAPLFSYVTDQQGSASGFTFLIGALYFANVVSQASSLGTDTAYFYSYPGNVFTGSISASTLTGSNPLFASFSVQATGYKSVLVWASGSGTDTATLTATGGDSFIGTSAYSELTSSGVTVEVLGYAMVNATGTSSDTAYLYDAAGNNLLTASGSTATLSTSVGGYTANGFGTVVAEHKTGKSDKKQVAAMLDFVLETTGYWATS